MIRHQTRGCHAWSLNGSPHRAHQILRLAVGPPYRALTVINGDVRSHRLVQLHGPKVAPRPWPARPPKAAARMRPGAQLALDFVRRGVYRFVTRPGPPPAGGVAGQGNLLTLTVIVS